MSHLTRRNLALAAALASTIFATEAAIASPVTGLWQTADDNGQVQIFDCGASLCGRLVTSDALTAHPDTKDVNNPDAAQRGRVLKGINIVLGFSGGPKTGAVARSIARRTAVLTRVVSS